MAGPIESFAVRLLEGTKNGSFKWKLSETPNMLEVDAGSGRVTLHQVTEDNVELEIFDADGNAVGEVASDPYTPGSWQPWELALRELYPLAVLQARGTTDVLSGLEEELGLKPSDDVPF